MSYTDVRLWINDEKNENEVLFVFNEMLIFFDEFFNMEYVDGCIICMYINLS